MSIKNPNDIIDQYVAEYRDILGDTLVSIIMYGSAVTHEYRPGISDINTAVILTQNTISVLAKTLPFQRKWIRRLGVVPFFMTLRYIESSLDTYPIEFLNMRLAYRVLHGADVLAGLDIKKEHLRLQCEHELKGISLHLRTGFIQAQDDTRALLSVLLLSRKSLMPVFKALLVLHDRKVPNIRSEVIGAVEDQFGLGASVLSDVFDADPGKRVKGRHLEVFDQYVSIVDSITATVDISHKGEVA